MGVRGEGGGVGGLRRTRRDSRAGVLVRCCFSSATLPAWMESSAPLKASLRFLRAIRRASMRALPSTSSGSSSGTSRAARAFSVFEMLLMKEVAMAAVRAVRASVMSFWRVTYAIWLIASCFCSSEFAVS